MKKIKTKEYVIQLRHLDPVDAHGFHYVDNKGKKKTSLPLLKGKYNG
jgi:hypothetical protein